MAKETEKPTGVRRYRKGRTLCDTIYGRTRYGKDLLTGNWVIIKESKKWNVQEKISIRGFHVAEDLSQEISLHKYLQSFPDCSPHIVDLIDVCQDPSYIYVITEFCEAGDLFTFLQRNHPIYVNSNSGTNTESADSRVDLQSWWLVVQGLFRQLIKGVSWMHSKRVCHRDISLENVLIHAKGLVKIIDFGVSKKYKATNENFRTKKGFVGKQGYCSAEVFNDKEYDGRAADLYSCGVILFILLTGAPPYQVPSYTDSGFRLLMEGRIEEILAAWKRPVPPEALKVLKAIFRPEESRITMKDLLLHTYLNSSPEPASSPLMDKVNESPEPITLAPSRMNNESNSVNKVGNQLQTIKISEKKDDEEAAEEMLIDTPPPRTISRSSVDN